MKKAIHLCVALFFSGLSGLWGQTKISILSSDTTTIQKGADGQRFYHLKGNVGLQQDVARMYCDSAILVQPQNTFTAYGGVRIRQADTLTVTGEELYYDGTTRTFTIDRNVVLTTPSSTLRTKQLRYNRNTSTAYYTTRSTLERKDLVLTANNGAYNTKAERVQLRGQVEAVDSAYSLFTDTLVYFPNRNTYHFAGPSTLLRDSTVIECRIGQYLADTSQLNLGQGATISSPGNFIAADSLSYNLRRKAGVLFNQALVADSGQGFVLESDFIDYLEEPNTVDAFSPVYYRQSMDGDTLYARGDSLVIREDSAGYRTVVLDGNTLFYSEKFQGISDQFRYREREEDIFLWPTPILWSERSQFQSDTARLTLENKKLDSLELLGSVRLVSLTEDSLSFDQAVGKRLFGGFEDNELQWIRLEGNAQSIMHLFNDGTLNGINQSACSWIGLTFIDGQVKRVKAARDVEASFITGEALQTTAAPSLPDCKEKFDDRTRWEQTRPPAEQLNDAPPAPL